MNDTNQTGTAVGFPTASAIATAFRASDQIDAILERIAAEVRGHAPDVSTAAGRKAIASLAYKVAQSKTAMDDAGKALNEDARKQIVVVDAERRKIRERLDALRDEVRAPLTAWEAAEDARVQKLKDRLDRVRVAHTMLPEGATADQIAALLARVEVIAIDDTWSEFVADAAKFKDQAVATLRHMRDDTAKREAQEAEIARLRAEADARAEADRLRIEAEQADAARIAAEKAEAERQAAIERAAADRAKRAAEDARLEAERAAQAREEAFRRQIEDDRAREEKARQDAIAAAAKAEARHAREMADAKAEQDRAAQAERDRIAAEAKRDADARAKREADAAHRAKIAGDIAAALRTMAGAATPESIADALMSGKIPHVQVML